MRRQTGILALLALCLLVTAPTVALALSPLRRR